MYDGRLAYVRGSASFCGSSRRESQIKREAEMLVGLSMRRQCRAICVKRAIYFSRSRRECPRRYFGREESDSVNLQRPRGRGSRRRLRRLCLLIGLDTCCQAAAVARGGAAESDATAARRSDTPSMTMPLFVHEENSRCG